MVERNVIVVTALFVFVVIMYGLVLFWCMGGF